MHTRRDVHHLSGLRHGNGVMVPAIGAELGGKGGDDGAVEAGAGEQGAVGVRRRIAITRSAIPGAKPDPGSMNPAYAALEAEVGSGLPEHACP